MGADHLLACAAEGCGGRLRVIETRAYAEGKRRRRRCERCGETYTTIESVLREGSHNATAMTQSHRLLDRIMLLDPGKRQAVAAVVQALEAAEVGQ